MTKPAWRNIKDTHTLFEKHNRRFETNKYIYPVVSRRSRGVSVGVNLNLDKRCNFDCVYCQIDRSEQGESIPLINEPIDLDLMREELVETVQWAADGRIFEHPWFEKTPDDFRRLNDIALSGSGEPTLCPQFAEVVRLCADVRHELSLPEVKLVLITNATTLHVPKIQTALELFDPVRDEIWAKLEAGTEAYYNQILRSKVPFKRVLDNLLETSQRRPLVIQTLMMKTHGDPPSDNEVAAYIARLRHIVDQGGQLRTVQLHTVARTPAESWVEALDDDHLDRLATQIRQATGIPVEVYYG